MPPRSPGLLASTSLALAFALASTSLALAACVDISGPPAAPDLPPPSFATPAAPSQQPQPPPPPPPRRHAPTLPPLPPDQVPERLGTPPSSEAARPWWGGGMEGYAPQTTQLRALYDARDVTARDAGALSGEMLVCAAGVRYSEDKIVTQSYSQADLTIKVGFGAHPDTDQDPLLEIKGPEDRNEMLFAIPLLALKPKDPIAFRVLDRDVFSNNLIDDLKARYDGKLPLHLAGKRAHVECWPVPRATVEIKAAQALAVADAALAKLDVEYLPDAEGGGRLGILDATGPFKQVAALVGWDDPRLLVRMQRAAMLERRFDDEARAEFRKLEGAQPPLDAWITMHSGERALRVEKLVCGRDLAPYKKAIEYEADNAGCVLHIAVKNLTAAPADIGGGRAVDGIDVAVLDGTAERHPVQLIGREIDGKLKPPERGERHEVAPGAIVTLLYKLEADEQFNDTYFNGRPKPLTANLDSYRPLLLWARYHPGNYEKDEIAYLRIP